MTGWYCRQKTHCGKGMTFAINPTMAKSYADFLSMAIAQNGTASTSVMADAVAATAMSTVTLIGGQGSYVSTTAMAEAASSTVAVDAAATSAVVVASAPAMVNGFNSGSGNSCECSCFCGVAAYPQGWGVNNIGGMGGALPAPWASSSVSAAAVMYSASSSMMTEAPIATDSAQMTSSDTAMPMATTATAAAESEPMTTTAAAMGY